MVVEDDGAAGEAVERGRVNPLVAVGAEMVTAQRVGDDERRS